VNSESSIPGPSGAPEVLRGRTLIVARARPGRSAMAASLRALGAEVLELPKVERKLLPPPQALTGFLHGRSDGVLVVASEEAARVVNRALEDAPDSVLPQIVAVGLEAASILGERDATPLAVTEGACRESLAELRAFVRNRRVLVPTAERGRPALCEELARLEGHVETCLIATEVQVLGEWPPFADLVALGSSSAAHALYADAPPRALLWTAVAIGEHTKSAAHALGVTRVVLAREDTRASVIEAAVALLTRTVPATPKLLEGRP